MTRLNLVRLGHLHTPTGDVETGVLLDRAPQAEGPCRTALVVHVPVDNYVGLAVWNANGGQETRANVPVGDPSFTDETFHLSADCPWKR